MVSARPARTSWSRRCRAKLGCSWIVHTAKASKAAMVRRAVSQSTLSVVGLSASTEMISCKLASCELSIGCPSDPLRGD